MSWIGLVQVLLGIVSTVASYLKDRQLIDAGVAEAVGTHLQGALDEIDKANKAGQAVESDLATHPDHIKLPDGFERPD